MSLILEALRKSEAERRRGSTPDVAMELPPVPAARPRATPAWLLPTLALGIGLLLGGWWWLQRDTATPQPPAAAAALPPQTVIDGPAPAVVVAPPLPASPPPAVPVAEPPVATQPAPAPSAAPVASAPLPPPARPLPSASTPARDVADIDATSMPPVKLSMHMWDEAPSRRFVIIDGQRMGEGDRNGEVAVVAIERDGVVVERNGQRARVPLP